MHMFLQLPNLLGRRHQMSRGCPAWIPLQSRWNVLDFKWEIHGKIKAKANALRLIEWSNIGKTHEHMNPDLNAPFHSNPAFFEKKHCSGWWWLEPWNFRTFPSYWECHHPNWRTHSIIFRVGQPPANQLWIIYLTWWSSIAMWNRQLVPRRPWFPPSKPHFCNAPDTRVTYSLPKSDTLCMDYEATTNKSLSVETPNFVSGGEETVKRSWEICSTPQ
jgi:hypothetical protein